MVGRAMPETEELAAKIRQVLVKDQAGDDVVAIPATQLQSLRSVAALTEHALQATGDVDRWATLLWRGRELPAEGWQRQLLQEDRGDVLELTLVPQPLPVLSRSGQSTLELLEAVRARLAVPSLPIQLKAMEALHRLLSAEREAAVEAAVAGGLLPALLPLAEAESLDLSRRVFTVLMMVTCSTSEHCRSLLEEGALPVLLAGAGSSDLAVKDRAVWALGNLAGSCVELRDRVLEEGALVLLGNVLAEATRLSATPLARRAALAVACCGSGQPAPGLGQLRPCLPAVGEAISADVLDREVAVDLLGMLGLVTHLSVDGIEAVLDTGAAPCLVNLTESADGRFDVATPALLVVTNILAGTDAQVQAMLHVGVLPRLRDSLDLGKAPLWKEALRALSNVAGSGERQVRALVQQGLVPRIAAFLTDEITQSVDVKREAVRAFGNLLECADDTQLQVFIDQEAVRPLLQCVAGFEGEDREATAKAVLALMRRMSQLNWRSRRKHWCLDALQDFVADLEAGGLGVDLEPLGPELAAARAFARQLAAS